SETWRIVVTRWSYYIGPLESTPRAVADVEHVDLFLFFHHAVNRAVDVRLVAVKQVSEFVVFRGHGAPVRLFFQVENRLLEPAIPLQSGVGVVGIDPPIDLRE